MPSELLCNSASFNLKETNRRTIRWRLNAALGTDPRVPSVCEAKKHSSTDEAGGF
jgi:hypothetical protein